MTFDSLPKFPEFIPLKELDLLEYENFYSNFEPYSDFHTINLYIWLNLKSDLHLSNLNGNIIYRFTDPFSNNNELQYSVLGKNSLKETVNTFLSSGITSKLDMVPEEVINQIDDNTLEFMEDIDNNDYILDAVKLSHLVGSDLKNLRRDCNSFMRNYGEHVTIQDSKLEPSNIHELINNLHTWDLVFAKTGNDSDLHERKALNILLQNVDKFDLYSMKLNISNVMEGFVIYHGCPQSGYIMVNTVKVSYRYPGLYDFSIFALANRVATQETKLINFEQDLGIEGLRNYKKSLKPIKYLKRYTITKRSSI